MKLDPYADPGLYDRVIAAGLDDLPYYMGLAKEARGPVLELACGSGRLTLPLAKAGVEVCGLDSSEAMLDAAETKAAAEGLQVEWVRADMRHFQLGRPFALVILAFNSLQHLLERSEVEALLKRVRSHLAPGGRFAFDVHNPKLDLLARDPVERYFVEPSPEAREDEVVMWEGVRYDSAAQVNHITWTLKGVSGGEEREIRLALRQYFPQELRALLEYNGFKVEHCYGDFGKKPFGDGDLKQVLVCT